MAISEFRYNKKTKHYSYIFSKKGDYRKNILISTKSKRKKKRKNGTYKEYNNVPLYKHPNPRTPNEKAYLIPKIESTHKDSFGRELRSWKFHNNDKRIVKRIKKGKIKKSL